MNTELTIDTNDGTIKLNGVPLSHYPMEITTEQAVLHLQKALKEDPGYYYGWQANIAMAFKDEYAKRASLGHHINSTTVHEIANTAAKRFLDILLLNIEQV